MEIIYPTLGVKFVAIQERVDTETGEGTEMMPFHNIFNEWYAAQTSKKVRAVWAMKAANGKRSNFRVPYGYKRDERDKEKWLVDDAAAEVVRRIYHLCLEGKGPEQIARLLQKEKVLTPTAYYYSVGSSSANRPIPSDPYLWKDSTIDAILSNRKYTGCMVNLKTTTVSYKVHKLIRKPEEEWSIVPESHRKRSLTKTLGLEYKSCANISVADCDRENKSVFPDWFFVQTAVQSSTFVRLRV